MKVKIGINGFKQITIKHLTDKFWLATVGSPGSYKTVFCITEAEHQLQNGACLIYVTTEMSRHEIIGQARTFGFNWEEYINQQRLIIIDTENQRWDPSRGIVETTDEKGTKDLVEFDTFAEAILWARKVYDWELNQFTALIIDSVASLWEDKPAMSRKYFRFIKRRTQNWFNLVIVTSQLAIGTSRAFGFGIEHGVDGIIRTGEYFENGEMKNWLLPVKMRGMPVNKKLFKTKVNSSGGLEIGEPLNVEGRYATVYDAFSG